MPVRMNCTAPGMATVGEIWDRLVPADDGAEHDAGNGGEDEADEEVLAAVSEVLEKMVVQQIFPESLRNSRRAAHEQGRDPAGGPHDLPDDQRDYEDAIPEDRRFMLLVEALARARARGTAHGAAHGATMFMRSGFSSTSCQIASSMARN